MPRKKRNQKLCETEAGIVAMFSHKLEALFQRQTKTYKKEPCRKSKDKGGDKKNTQNKKTSLKSIKAIKEEFSHLLAFYRVGLPHTKLVNQPELSREQIALINIDFEGLYYTPKSDTLSAAYKTAKFTAANYDIESRYTSGDYDLNQIPIWSEMKKFNSFRQMYRPICKQLSLIGFNPAELNQLNFSDTIDLIASHNRQHPEHRLIGQRSRFLKMFAACYGEEFITKTSDIGNNKDEKDHNRQLAQNFLTYIYYLDCPSKKAPAECAASANHFSVHHSKNRKYANELDDYSKINNFSNLMLAPTFPHHKILHTPVEIDIDQNVVYFGGFLQEFRISRDPQKERLYEQGLIKEFKLNHSREH